MQVFLFLHSEGMLESHCRFQQAPQWCVFHCLIYNRVLIWMSSGLKLYARMTAASIHIESHYFQSLYGGLGTPCQRICTLNSSSFDVESYLHLWIYHEHNQHHHRYDWYHGIWMKYVCRVASKFVDTHAGKPHYFILISLSNKLEMSTSVFIVIFILPASWSCHGKMIIFM